jgi:membrane-associated phospholipid phosphatase
MRVAAAVSTVFTPELFLLLTTLLLVGYERRDGPSPRALAARTGVVAGAWALAFAVYQGGPELVSTSVPGGDDFFAALGLIVAFAGIGLAWRRFDWGSLLPPYAALIVVTSIVHLAVVPVWNASSHVIYAAVPALALLAVDRRFAPLLAVPPLLVWSRISTGAHTVDEAVGGLLVAALVVGGAFALDRLPEEGTAGVEAGIR